MVKIEPIYKTQPEDEMPLVLIEVYDPKNPKKLLISWLLNAVTLNALVQQMSAIHNSLVEEEIDRFERRRKSRLNKRG